MKRNTPDHPKTLWLRTGLGLTKRDTVGLLEMLWHWTAKNAPQGDIGKWSDAQIAEGVEWTGDPAELVRNLVDAGFLDNDSKYRLLVHDWHEHADGAHKKQLQRMGLPFCRAADKRQPKARQAASARPTSEGDSRPTAVPCRAVPVQAVTPQPPQGGAAAAAAPVSVVFDHWREVMEHPEAKLTPKRERLVKARLREGYTAFQLLEAIDGCRASPFHMGQDPKSAGRVYDDLALICRDGEHVESFRRLVAGSAKGPPGVSHGLPTTPPWERVAAKGTA